MTEEQFLIGELAKRAGVSVRTIRYYISEGLLPAPDTKGRYAAYDERYIARIRLIQHWKKAYLPLREIRSRLDALSEQDIQEQVEQAVDISPAPSIADSAEDYISRVMHPNRRVMSMVAPAPQDMDQILFDHSDALPELEPSFLRRQGGTAPQQLIAMGQVTELPAPDSSWLHLTLTDGVELHIRQPISPAVQDKIDRLVHFARRLFK